jgi:hypothetical protein
MVALAVDRAGDVVEQAVEQIVASGEAGRRINVLLYPARFRSRYRVELRPCPARPIRRR